MRELSSYVYDAFDLYYACLMQMDQKSGSKMNLCDY
jgi:hypothetical protein